VTRNSLASESVLGINQGAALGVAIAVVMPSLMIVSLDVMSIIGAIVAGLVTFSIAGGLGGVTAAVAVRPTWGGAAG
jgi:ABC-type Fe3+-siderophore transport system permease subunit